ncbi:hypothetical protein [Streptomyces sp. NPDC048606]|uniref:hypothetical protein n=1 Tax=Streptomyces sp. NPDC048606 TaxID=3154726 RepID=UPI0034349DC7
MAGDIHRSHIRKELGTDTSDDPLARTALVVEPSSDLLERARVGWERFTDSVKQPADE